MAASAPLDVVGTSEIAEEYGIPKHRVFRFMARGLFPAPDAELRLVKIWRRSKVEAAVTKLKQQGHL